MSFAFQPLFRARLLADVRPWACIVVDYILLCRLATCGKSSCVSEPHYGHVRHPRHATFLIQVWVPCLWIPSYNEEWFTPRIRRVLSLLLRKFNAQTLHYGRQWYSDWRVLAVALGASEYSIFIA